MLSLLSYLVVVSCKHPDDLDGQEKLLCVTVAKLHMGMITSMT
jgi:hypothetical protein